MRNGRLRRGFITVAIASLVGGVGLISAPTALADDGGSSGDKTASPSAPAPRGTTGEAAGAPLTALLRQVDGVAPFDKDDTAGYDSKDNNGIIRTNDTMTYRVEVRSEGKAKANATIRIPLSAGMEAQKLPPYCKANSSITPDALPAPGSDALPLPITKDSWKKLPSQEILCNVGTLQPAATFLYGFTAKVRPEVPQGTAIKTTAYVSADGEKEVASAAVSAKVSARAKFNITKNSWQGQENAGYMYNQFHACKFDPTQQCSYFTYPVMITAPGQGGKGLSPAQSPFTFVDDLSAKSFYPDGITTSAKWKEAGTKADEKYSPRLISCRSASNGWWQHPAGQRNSGNTDENSVRNSGKVECDQPAVGQPVNFTLTNADTTAYTTPTRVSNPNQAIPADRAYIASLEVFVEVPNAVITDFGLGEPSRKSLHFDNVLRDFAPVGIDGVTNDPAADPKWDDHKKINRVLTFGDGFSKYFTGFPNDPNNTPASQYKAGWATHPGVAGSSSVWAGDGIVLPGQKVISTVHFATSTPAGGAPTSRIGCDTWDNNMMSLAAGDYAKGKDLGYAHPSNGKAVWASGYYSKRTYAADPTPTGLTIEYGTGPVGPGEESRCGDSDSTSGWTTDPASVPGNDPTAAANGIYTAVNKVRIFNTLTPEVEGRQDLWIAIAMQARANPLDGGDDFKTGTPIPNYSAVLGVNKDVTKDELLADPDAKWTLSTYDKDSASGSNGDRLTVGTAIARISKEVTDPKSGLWTATTPAFQAEDEVAYKLTPSLTAGASSIIKPSVVVEDCLPADQVFLSGTPAPSVATSDVPKSAEISCKTNETYVKWELGPQEINGSIAPIEYKVRIASTASNGTMINTTVISAENELSKLAKRTATHTIIVNSPAGVKLEKRALEPVVEINRNDGATKRDMVWHVTVANIGDMPNISDIDVIDVLPRQGINDSKFTGKLALKSINPIEGKNVTFAYTADAALVQDPTDARNAADGATVWCDAMSGGKVVSGSGAKAACPTGPESVTGMRLQRAGAFAPADRFTVQVAMTATGNSAGDVYINRAMAQAKGLKLPFGPINAPVATVSSSVGDYVWLDANGNGLQDADEQGIANLPVTMTGKDSVGNAVSLKTTTDAQGAYGFAGLTAGEYTVNVDSKGADFTHLNVGSDHGVDSDVDANGNVTFTLNQGKEDLTLDAGVLPPSKVQIEKSVENVTRPGEKAQPGDILRYTVVGENQGPGAFTDVKPAMIVDDLTEVLDDGIYGDDAVHALTGASHPMPVNRADPTNPANPAAQLGSLGYTEPELTWSGPLGVNDTVTITYTVTAKKQADLGDASAQNFARITGEGVPPPAGPCTQEEIDAGLCDSTVTPILKGGLEVRKLVETTLGSGQFIEADDTDKKFGEYILGQNITWQIKVTNTGEYALHNIAVTDPLVPSCDNTIALLEPGHSAIYECTSVASTDMTNVITASVPGSDNEEFTETDPASIKIVTKPTDPNAKKPGDKVALTGTNSMVVAGVAVLIVALGLALVIARSRSRKDNL